MTEDETKELGRFELRQEPETGFLRIIHEGTLTEEGARSLAAEYERFAPAEGAAFVIADYRKATGITFGGRRALAATRLRGEIYFANFGAPFAHRVVSNLVIRAVGIFVPVVSEAFASEAEARAWLTQKRNAYLAQKRSP